MSKTVPNGKGSNTRPTKLSEFESNWDQIEWISRKRRKGRPVEPHKDKKRYTRKVKHKGDEDE
jgi:hypothetical protein